MEVSMKSLLILIQLGICFLVSMQASAARQLVNSLSSPPRQRILFNGAAWISSPVADGRGGVYFGWRAITGAVYKELVTSVYLYRLGAGGRFPWGARARIPVQAMHSLGDRGQAGGEVGIVPDGRGGIYYLWASYLLRFDREGRSLWPAGKQYLRKPGPLWRRPSRIRYIKSKRERIRDVRLFPDGKGNALVYWRSPNSVRVNKISAQGRCLWGSSGVELCNSKDTYEKGTGVAGWRGQAAALVAHGRYGNYCVVKFLSPQGKIVRRSRPFPFDLSGSSSWRIAADGSGGLVLLYFKSVFHDRLKTGSSVGLVRFNRFGGIVYNRLLTGYIPNARGPARPVLRVMQDGTALAGWHTAGKIGGTLFCIRVDRDGRSFWHHGAVRISASGQKRFRGLSFITKGKFTWLMYELSRKYRGQSTMFIRMQKIDGRGRKLYSGAGWEVSPGGGFYPFLVRSGGQISAFYYDTRQLGRVSGHNVPVQVHLP